MISVSGDSRCAFRHRESLAISTYLRGLENTDCLKMGGQVSRNDFEWVYTQEPHVARRKLILDKYPEIKKLMGPDHEFKYIAIAMVIFNILSCYFVGQLSYFWITVLAYFLGGVVNHSLTLAIHDIAHNAAFGNKYPLANRLFGMLINIPIGVPMSISFKIYHIEHHRYQGIDGYDVDLPSAWEGRFFTNIPLKILWLFLQPLFYAFRPFIVRPKPPSKLEILNVVIQVTADALIWYFFGFKSLYYLLIGTFLSLGLHPMAAHFIAEHYMFDRGYETYSYYGPWNYLTFNVGYHMEHHDFPYIPGSRLPEVKRIAAEFYDSLPQHDSWLSVIYIYLFKPQMGPFSRVKRDFEDIHGKRKADNPHLRADNTMIPVFAEDPPFKKTTTNGHVANGHVANGGVELSEENKKND